MHFKKIINTTLLLIISFIVLPGCGKDKVKPPADSLLATEAFAAIEKIKDAYVEKDAYTLKIHSDPALAESIIKELSFQQAELSYTSRMVKIADSSVRVNISWKGTWTSAKGEKLENRGVADLVFHRDTMKLTYVEGDNPFIVPLGN